MFVGNSLTGFNDMPGQVGRFAMTMGHHPYIEQYLAFGQNLDYQLQRADLAAALAGKKWDYL